MNPGLSSAVQEALQRRTISGPAPQLAQVSQSAPMQEQLPQPMNPSQMTATSTPPAPKEAQSQKYQPQNQQDMIIMALIEHLKANNQLEKEKLKLNSGQERSIPQLPPQPLSSSGDYFRAPSTAVMNQQSGHPFQGGF